MYSIRSSKATATSGGTYPSPSSCPLSETQTSPSHPFPPWDDNWSAHDDDLLLSLECNERLRPSWQYVARKMQRPLSQIQARWTDLLDLQRVATSSTSPLATTSNSESSRFLLLILPRGKTIPPATPSFSQFQAISIVLRVYPPPLFLPPIAQSFGSNSCFMFHIPVSTPPGPAYSDSLLPSSSMTSRSTSTTSRPRPSMASHLRDLDEPTIVSTTFPKKARPTAPPPSLRTLATSLDHDVLPSGSNCSTSTPTTTPTPSDLFGFLLKPNGERVRFLIPRPSLDFRLPEAKP